MAKNFRFHEGIDVEGWATSTPLAAEAIADIKDPDGATAKREITSIPSPFARIDLVKNAFDVVAKEGLDGDTIFHKMVSDALDIGQILFNYDKYQDDIDIIVWDSNIEVNSLLASENDGHHLLGESLRLHLDEYFDGFGKMYLLNYNKGPRELNIIGGTSPTSLFFTSANQFNLDGFQAGQDKFLDDSYTPLHNRDPEYIKYLFALRNQIENFPVVFESVDHYMEKVFEALAGNLRNVINNLDQNFITALETLHIDGGGQVVEINRVPLKKYNGYAINIRQKSDFRILAQKDFPGLPVLVLPNDTIFGDFFYVIDNWDNQLSTPYVGDIPFSERKLPFDGTPYPYITISDFLEPVIIRSAFAIDENYFEKGGYEGDKGYLLPLTPLFFEFFPVSFVSEMVNGKRVLEVSPLINDNVRITLRIPVQNGNFITYQRTYYNQANNLQPPEYNERENRGAIVENRINVGITPFYKFPSGVNAEYNATLYDADAINPLFTGINYSVDFYASDNQTVENVISQQRRYKGEENIDAHAFLVPSNFEYIQLQHNYATGILIPKFSTTTGGTAQFSFAIDFGTTNTHIEYRENASLPKPLELTERYHRGSLIIDNYPNEPLISLLENDLFPLNIQQGGQYEFPQRTVIAYHKKINFAQPIISMGNIAIPFKYEKASFAVNTEIETNLKWRNEDGSTKKSMSFFEQLIKMIRNKVLLNSGALNQTHVTWTYPASMSQFQLSTVEAQWNDVIEKYLGAIGSIRSVCESLPPFYYYTNVEGKEALTRPMVTIDIGGGTSDIAIFEGANPILFTSYRFASQAIFGDNFNRNININGFVNRFHGEIIRLLSENNLGQLGLIINSIKSSKNSTDGLNAYFSIANNKILVDNQIDIDFLELLKDDKEFKIIFLIFYVAQIYHLAHLIKKKDIDLPGIISFSGTASKLLTILDSTVKNTILKSLMSKIFEHVFDLSNEINIEIILAQNPKILTAKGALYLDGTERMEIKGINAVLMHNEQLLNQADGLTYSKADELMNATLGDYSEFLAFVKQLNRTNSFKENFGIETDIVDSTLGFLDINKEAALRMAIQNKIAGLNNPENEPISETFFFYPLMGSFGELAYRLSNNTLE